MKRTIISIALSIALAAMPVAAVAQSFESDSISAVDNAPSVKAISGGIQITVSDNTARQFYIYSITGQMVKAIETGETVSVDLPQGCYIVKCASWSKKIVVR